MHIPTCQEFPHFTNANHRVTSPRTGDYNCIAWAAGEDDRFWWPHPAASLSYWPANVSRAETVENFVQAFATLGYVVCTDDTLDEGYEKVVLYVDANNKPTHMARQLANGLWTSKLGQEYDIEHDNPAVVNGAVYGSVSTYMSRKKNNNVGPNNAE